MEPSVSHSICSFLYSYGFKIDEPDYVDYRHASVLKRRSYEPLMVTLQGKPFRGRLVPSKV